MYRTRQAGCDSQPIEYWSETSDWFQVEGDLDDFIFYDPTVLPPDPDWAK